MGKDIVLWTLCVNLFYIGLVFLLSVSRDLNKYMMSRITVSALKSCIHQQIKELYDEIYIGRQ